VTTNAVDDKVETAAMGIIPDDERKRLLDPVDRVSEILFGLIMAVTIVGSVSIATAGRDELRTVMWAALGCNLAWGLVDAVMYVIRTVTERTRNQALARRIVQAEAGDAHGLIAQALPNHIATLVGTDELEGIRQRLFALQVDRLGVLRVLDFLEAVGIFVMVVIATFPVVIPFLLTDNAATAMHWSQAITLVMLFLAGFALGRHAGYPKPLRPGLAMAVFGALLIAAVKALGG